MYDPPYFPARPQHPTRPTTKTTEAPKPAYGPPAPAKTTPAPTYDPPYFPARPHPSSYDAPKPKYRTRYPSPKPRYQPAPKPKYQRKPSQLYKESKSAKPKYNPPSYPKPSPKPKYQAYKPKKVKASKKPVTFYPRPEEQSEEKPHPNTNIPTIRPTRVRLIGTMKVGENRGGRAIDIDTEDSVGNPNLLDGVQEILEPIEEGLEVIEEPREPVSVLDPQEIAMEPVQESAQVPESITDEVQEVVEESRETISVLDPQEAAVEPVQEPGQLPESLVEEVQEVVEEIEEIIEEEETEPVETVVQIEDDDNDEVEQLKELNAALIQEVQAVVGRVDELIAQAEAQAQAQRVQPERLVVEPENVEIIAPVAESSPTGELNIQDEVQSVVEEIETIIEVSPVSQSAQLVLAEESAEDHLLEVASPAVEAQLARITEVNPEDVEVLDFVTSEDQGSAQLVLEDTAEPIGAEEDAAVVARLPVLAEDVEVLSDVISEATAPEVSANLVFEPISTDVDLIENVNVAEAESEQLNVANVVEVVEEVEQIVEQAEEQQESARLVVAEEESEVELLPEVEEVQPKNSYASKHNGDALTARLTIEEVDREPRVLDTDSSEVTRVAPVVAAAAATLTEAVEETVQDGEVLLNVETTPAPASAPETTTMTQLIAETTQTVINLVVGTTEEEIDLADIVGVTTGAPVTTTFAADAVDLLEVIQEEVSQPSQAVPVALPLVEATTTTLPLVEASTTALPLVEASTAAPEIEVTTLGPDTVSQGSVSQVATTTLAAQTAEASGDFSTTDSVVAESTTESIEITTSGFTIEETVIADDNEVISPLVIYKF